VSREVWFVVDHLDGAPNPASPELATAASAIDGRAVAVVCAGAGSEVPGRVAPYSDHVVVLEAEGLEAYRPDAWGAAIVELAGQRSPEAILLPHNPLGRDLGPWLAARMATGMISACVDLSWDDGLVGTRSVYGRKLLGRERVVTDGPAIASCQPGAFTAREPGAAAEIEIVATEVDEGSVSWSVVDFRPVERGDEDITEAEVIVAGGRGLGDKEKFEMVVDLAKELGGSMGATRPVVDVGWAGHDRQIGSSGVNVRPRLYFAIGISGAIQHVSGMKDSDVIVAINKDPQAPIFEYAHYGIVDDLFAVTPLLLEKLREAKG
jgi:electron transfer flavoprotein alpha subunit